MMAPRYDWTINQGETSPLVYTRTVTSSGAVDNFNTGVTFRMQVKDKAGGTAVFTSTSANFTHPVNGASNVVTIELSATETAAIPGGRYVYDIEAVNEPATNKVTRILEGSFFVRAEVTTSV